MITLHPYAITSAGHAQSAGLQLLARRRSGDADFWPSRRHHRPTHSARRCMKPLPFEITGPYRRNPRSPWRWFVLLLALAAPVFWALFFSSP